MKKLKVIKPFYDKKEDKYVYPDKQPTIDREEKRAAELIAAGVAEEYAEAAEQADSAPADPESAPADEGEAEPGDAPAEEKPPRRGGRK